MANQSKMVVQVVSLAILFHVHASGTKWWSVYVRSYYVSMARLTVAIYCSPEQMLPCVVPPVRIII